MSTRRRRQPSSSAKKRGAKRASLSGKDATNFFGETELSSKKSETEGKRVGEGGCSSLCRFVSDMFLPVGYPHSVEKGYIEYQFWDLCQGLTSYVRSSLAIRETLIAFGVGDVAANATSAALSKNLLDAASKIGGLTFTWSVSSKFGHNIRQWRLFADVINDIGLTLTMIAPLCGEKYFLSVAACANIATTMCGITGGATKATISHFFAKKNNLADLCAKEGSQETFGNLVGIFLGYIFLSFQDSANYQLIWSSFFVLTVLHIIANVYAVRHLRFNTINNCRFGLLFDKFYNRKNTVEAQMDIDSIAASEPYLMYWTTMPVRIFAGQKHSAGERNVLHEHDRYRIFTLKENSGKNDVHIALKKEAAMKDILKAFFHANYLKSHNGRSIDVEFEEFFLCLVKEGWDVERVDALTVGNWRYDW
jgi:hypothetical protein